MTTAAESMATGPEVTYEVVDHVAWVTINRPEVRNALNLAARDQWRAALERFEADADARVLVLTGAGDQSFCAGADLKEMADDVAQAPSVPPIDFIAQPGRTIQLSKPTIAAVNGHALAGGFLLAQSCDLVVAAAHATFGITEIRWSRGAPWAVPLIDLVGPRAAMEILLTGDPISAERALRIGLVNRVVPAERLRAEAATLAARIAEHPPLAVAAARRTVQLALEHDRATAFERAEEVWAPVYLSADAQEGPRAFREKRRPVWQGR